MGVLAGTKYCQLNVKFSTFSKHFPNKAYIIIERVLYLSCWDLVESQYFLQGAMKFKKGMKLEAKDRLNPSMVCVATLTKVRKKEILIHFDGWSNKYDYWCDPTSNDIHPRDWCERNHHALTRPKGILNRKLEKIEMWF